MTATRESVRIFLFMLCWFGHFFAPAHAQRAEAKNEPRYWNTQWNFRSVNVGKLVDRLEAIGIELGVELEGTATVELDVGVPLTALRDGAAYRLDGRVTSPELSVDQVQLENVQAVVRYRDGVATLRELKSQVVANTRMPSRSAGQVSGEATVQLVPQGNVQAKLEVDNLVMAPIIDLVESLVQPINSFALRDGRLTGSMSVDAPLAEIWDLAAFDLSGGLTAKQLKITGLPPAEATFPSINIKDGILSADAFELTALTNDRDPESIQLLGEVRLPLRGAGEFRIEVTGDNLPSHVAMRLLASSDSIAALTQGKVDLKLLATGTRGPTLSKSDWSVEGAIASPGLTALGVDIGRLEHDIRLTADRLAMVPRRDVSDLPDSFRLKQLTCRYRMTDESIRVENIDGRVFGGNVGGRLDVPLTDNGVAELELSVSDVRPRFRVSISQWVRPVIVATLAGDVRWKLPLDRWDRPAAHDGRADITVTDVRLGDEPIGSVRAKLLAQQGKLSLQADGQILDGTLNIETLADVAQADTWSDLMKRLTSVRMQWREVDLGSLLSVVTPSATSIDGKLSGRLLAAKVPHQASFSERLTASRVELSVGDLRQNGRLIARKFELAGRLNDDSFLVDSLTGDYAGGFVRAQGQVRFASNSQTWDVRPVLRVNATRLDLPQAFWFLGDTAETLYGRASLSVTLTGVGTALRMRGHVDGRDVGAAGVVVGPAHSAFAVDLNVATRRWRARMSSIQAHSGGGQLVGTVKLASGSRSRGGVDVTSQWRAQRVDVFRLWNRPDGKMPLAHGEITGAVTVSGDSVRSVDDLVGKFNLKLDETRGAAIPGATAISRFLGPMSLATERFDVGEAKGSLRGGAVILDEFWLGSNSALVRADGKVFLRGQRLDLNALIATGNYADIGGSLGEMARQYALRTVLPASVILSVTELFRDRTVVVKIGGTVSVPIVRLRTVETFREEAIRFLLREGSQLVAGGTTAGPIDRGN